MPVNRINRLLSVPEMRDPLIATLKAVAPERVAIADAQGTVLAVPVLAPLALPPQAIALRTGHAVTALELVGASPQSPVMLAVSPPQVMPTDPLPQGCDAVLPPDSVSSQGVFIEITHSPAPGESVRLAGHDLAANTLLADRGALISPRLVLAMTLAGIETVEIIRPCVEIPAASSPESIWLAGVLRALGCLPVPESEGGEAHLVLGWSNERGAVLALRPGEAATTRLDPGAVSQILLPCRFDGMIAAFFALVLPAIEHLTGRSLARISRPLTRKIASGVGVTDIVLLKEVPEGFQPLSTGEITLASLVASDAIALIPAGSEGHAAGSMLAAIPLDLISLTVPTGERPI